MNFSGSVASQGGVQAATITLTAAQLRTLSAAGQGANVVPGVTGKRAMFLGALAFKSSGAVQFGAGLASIVNALDATGAGSFYFLGALNNLLTGGVVFGTALEVTGTSSIDTLGEGIWYFPTNYATVGANMSLTITVFYQYA